MTSPHVGIDVSVRPVGAGIGPGGAKKPRLRGCDLLLRLSLMANKRVLIQALVALLLVWGVVAGVRSLAGSKRVTAEKIRVEIVRADFEDWSDGLPPGASASARTERIEKVAEMFNQLDFAERDRAREERIGEEFFMRLAPSERERFVELTVEKSMQSLIRALDAMNADERRKIVERGLREIEDGRTEEEMVRAQEMSEELLNRITQEGLKAYFQQANADTKLDLAPLMEAMDGVVKGLRGNDFGPPQR